MPTIKKAAVIDELADQLDRATLTILTDYRGLKVGDLQTLRSTLRPMGAEYRIAKNTLTRIAAERIGIQGLETSLEGPLALVIAYGDVVGPAKAISDFARTSRILTVKGGLLDNRFIDAADVESLATLPSREALRGTLLGLMVSPLTRTVGVLSGPSRSLAYVLQARADQMNDQAQAAD